MKRLVRIRSSNFKVLITSATLDGEKVSRFFSGCPVLNVPGKLYPVEILYSKERPGSYIESSLKVAIGNVLTVEWVSVLINMIWFNLATLLFTCRYTCS